MSNKISYNYSIDLGTSQLGSFFIPLSSNQKIKKIGFNFSYNIRADDNVNYIITCENVNNEVVGNLNLCNSAMKTLQIGRAHV